MAALTILLPDEIVQRLMALASSRGVSLDKLFEVMSEAALNAHGTEARFKAMAAKAGRDGALEVLARLDRNERCQRRGGLRRPSRKCTVPADFPAFETPL
jgi:hypothetical protein